MKLSIEQIRSEFPILSQTAYGKPLVYFDNAATTQKPVCVIKALSDYYTSLNSNVHRGAHYLSIKASEAYENVRRQIQHFLHAGYAHEIVFTRGTTESINLVAATYGRKFIGVADEIIISHIEHHSNIVPWQMLCEEKGAKLKVIPVFDNGELDFEAFLNLLNERTRLLALTHVSNTLGTIVPVQKYIEAAHQCGVLVLIDGAQAAAHMKIDVQELDCDFYGFSGHKAYGPMGIGVLYGKEKWLNAMPPYQGGGEMILNVSFEKSTYNELPYKFEAGTPNVADAIALGKALEYIGELGVDQIEKREKELLDYLTQRLTEIPDIRIIGTASEKTSIVSFLIGEIHPYDAGTIIDRFGIAVRTGNHCNQPIMDRFGVPGTIRASLAFYNTTEEIDRLIEAIEKVKQMFA
ncbi:MAG: cysteine desulfurase [Bacteroidales bacterium]|nr:cysteine desulfurase [Bacteroidales bacterium]MDZ4205056.1 cysteine desulfurase [Bacteroidales bacterium]